MRPDHRSRGQSLVEFAVIGSLLIIILLGTVDFARAFYSQLVVRGAVAEGGYLMAQNPNAQAQAEERILLELGPLDEAAARTTITWDTSECQNDMQDTTLEVRYRHRFWFGSVLPSSEITLRDSTRVPQFGGCQ
jgi:hypothetical protein